MAPTVSTCLKLAGYVGNASLLLWKSLPADATISAPDWVAALATSCSNCEKVPALPQLQLMTRAPWDAANMMPS